MTPLLEVMQRRDLDGQTQTGGPAPLEKPGNREQQRRGAWNVEDGPQLRPLDPPT
jgi:hypothetical protein